MEIHLKQEVTYTPIPSPFLEEVEPFLRARGIEYELLFDDDIPEFVDRSVTLEGKRFTHAIGCIRSHVSMDDMQKIILKAWRPRRYGALETS